MNGVANSQTRYCYNNHEEDGQNYSGGIGNSLVTPLKDIWRLQFYRSRSEVALNKPHR